MMTSQKEPENYSYIDSINTCVADSLHDHDVWKNYFYNGSIWINTDRLSAEQQADTKQTLGYNIHDPSKGSIARGSLAAFNITMETFFQVHTSSIHDMTVTDLFNCFTCHNSAASIVLATDTIKARSPLYISHIFRSYLSYSSGVSKDKIESLRTQEFMDLLNVKRDANKK